MLGSYQFESLNGRHEEMKFLQQRARLRLDTFVELIGKHGFKNGDRVLEIGTGQGIRSRLIAEAAPNSEVIGLDRSDEMIEQARATAYPKNLTFQLGDVYGLDFPNEAFDFVYARLVFMHLTDPMRALGELMRVLRPGGRILIEDADRDCMLFEPRPENFSRFWDLVQDGQRRLGGDPNVGRKLASLLTLSGMRNIKPEVQPYIQGGDEILFLAKTLMPSLNKYLDLSDQDFGQKAIDELVALSEKPEAFMYHMWFVVSGQK